MNRREWLKMVFGASVAAAVAPLVDLTDTTPAFWEQPAIKQLRPWRITFPDGGVFSFDAIVTKEAVKATIDGSTTVELTLQPTGPMEIESAPARPSKMSLHPPPATVVMRDGQQIGEVKEIQLAPSEIRHIEATAHDAGETYHIPGLRRQGAITFEINWDPDNPYKSNMDK